MSEKHFLAWRDKDGLRKIEVFRNQALALRMYEAAEMEVDPAGEEVCLFGADSLATLCRTHASWFCPEML